MKKFLLLLFTVFLLSNAYSTDKKYYSQGTGDFSIANYANWNTNRGGGGTSPTSYLQARDTFVIQATHVLTVPLAMQFGFAPTGGSVLQVENGGVLSGNPGGLQPLTIRANNTFKLDDGATFYHYNTSFTQIFTGIENFAATSNFYISNTGNGNGPSTANVTGSFGNLFFTPNAGVTTYCNGLLPNIAGNLTINSSSSKLYLGGNSTITPPGTDTLNIGGNLSINNGMLIYSKDSTVGIINLSGNFSISSGGYMQNQCDVNPSTCYLNFVKNGIQTFTKVSNQGSIGGSGGSPSVGRSIDFVVKSGSVLDLANYVFESVNGDNTINFNLNSGAGLITSNTNLNAGNPGALTTVGSVGTFRNNGTRVFSTGASYTFNGASAQQTGNALPATVKNLTINNSFGVTLTGSCTVTDSLNLTSGLLTTAANTLTIAASGKVLNASANRYVNGNLKKFIPMNAAAASFEIGVATVYAPVNLSFSGTIADSTGSITAFTTTGDHPLYYTAGIDINKSVNRVWKLTNNTVLNGLSSYGATFNFDSLTVGEVDPGSNTANFIANYNNGTIWVTTTTGTRTSVSTQVSGITGFGEFYVGEYSVPASISTGTISGSPFCQGGAVAIPYTITGSFVAGNKFKVQLSNSSGSFASGTIFIDSVTATTGGTINTYIPSGLAAGTLYRIRVISTAPVVNGSDNGANIVVNALPVITVQPGNQTSYAGTAANPTFTVASSTGSPAYQWQYSVNGSTGWANVVNSTPANFSYTNANAATLTVATVVGATNGSYYYRCIVTENTTGCATNSNAATLTLAVPPTPTLTLLSPNACTAGNLPFTLTVTGTNFIDGLSGIVWNGTPLTTTFISATSLSATISSAQVASAATLPVTVNNTQGVVSGSLNFTVNPGGSWSLSAGALTGFGNVIITQQSVERSFVLTGTNLTNHNINVGPFSVYQFSLTPGGPYTNTLSIVQPGLNYSGTIYVVFKPTALTTYNGNIPVSGGSAAAINVPVTGRGVVGNTGTITPTAGYVYTDTIKYINYQSASGLTLANSVGVNGITVTDMGDDGLNVRLTQIRFALTPATGNAVRTLALFDGSTNLVEIPVANGDTTAIFSVFPDIIINDGAIRNLELRATFKTAQTDGTHLQFTVNQVTTSGSTNSGFGPIINATSTLVNTLNNIGVIASELYFFTQPSPLVNVSVNIPVPPVIKAQDIFGNFDKDFTFSPLTVVNTGGLGMLNVPTVPANISNGILTFPSNFQFTTEGTTTLVVTAEGLTTVPSDTIIVGDPTLITDRFRSITSGNWASNLTWQSSHDGITWRTPASIYPNNISLNVATNTIQIQNTHTVTVDTIITADQITVDAGAQLVITPGDTLRVTNAPGAIPDIVVDGYLRNSGAFRQLSSSLQVNGSFEHNADGGDLPTATWNTNSYAIITGIVNTTFMTSSSFVQSFYNLTWNCPNQLSDFVFYDNLRDSIGGGGWGIAVRGNFLVLSTNTGSIAFNNGGDGYTTSVLGNFDLQSGKVNLVTNNASAIGYIFSVAGNLNVKNGSFILSKQGNSIVTLNVGGNIDVSGGVLQTTTLVNGVTAAINVTNDFIVETEGIFDVSGYSSNASTGFSTINIGRDLLISTTNPTAGIRGFIPTAAESFTLNITRDFTISGGAKFINASAVYNTKNYLIKLGGNFNLSGAGSSFVFGNTGATAVNGTFSFSGAATGFSGGRTNATFTVGAGATFTPFTAPNGFAFDVSATQLPGKKLTLSNNFSLPGKTFTINNGATLDAGLFIISGGGGFTNASGGTLITANTNGVRGAVNNGTVQTTGTNVLATGSSYTYNSAAGATPQSTGLVALGTNVPANISILTANNTNVNLDATISVGASGSVPAVTLNTGGVFNLGNNGLTLQETDIPVLKTSGTITTTTATNLSFGSAGKTGGAAFALPANLFTTPPEINNFTINRTNSLTLGNQSFAIRGVLTSTSGTLHLNDAYFTLKSDAAYTARVAPVGGNFAYGNGRFVIERFYPAGRKWHLSTAPVTADAGRSIYNSWQNGGVAVPGSGTYITGQNPSAANGLDASPQNQFSLKSYNMATQLLVNVTDTKTPLISGTAGVAGTPDNVGYYFFVRGDRTPGNFYPPASNVTTIRDTGKIQYGTQTFTANAAAGKFTLIGNPFASPVNFDQLTRNNVSKKFWAWDPKLNVVGGYVIVDGTSGTYITSPATGVAQTKFLQSTQAVFVQTTGAGAASVLFPESSKSDSNNLNVFRPFNVLGLTQKLMVNIYLRNADGSTQMADGAVSLFDNAYADAIDDGDGIKFGNINEQFSIQKYGSSLALERRPVLTANDTIFYKFSKNSQRGYQMEIIAENLNTNGLEGFLEDLYTGTKIPLNMNGTTKTDFVLNADALSVAQNRFRIVFKPAGVVPVTFTSVKAWKKLNGGAGSLNTNQVEWKVSNEINIARYVVEKSADGSNFTGMQITAAVGNSVAGSITYSALDEQAFTGINYYRIRSIGTDGSESLSNIVKVVNAKWATVLSVYPNPVKGGRLGLQMNNLAAGKYGVRLLTSTGQLIYSKTFMHAANNAVEILNIGANVTPGEYQLEVFGDDKQLQVLKVIFE